MIVCKTFSQSKLPAGTSVAAGAGSVSSAVVAAGSGVRFLAAAIAAGCVVAILFVRRLDGLAANVGVLVSSMAAVLCDAGFVNRTIVAISFR